MPFPKIPNLNRRQLTLGVLSAAALAISPSYASAQSKRGTVQPAAATLAQREQTADQQVQHVLSRLTFGARPGEVQAVRAMGVDSWIAKQLDPSKVPDDAMNTFLHHFPVLTMDGEELQKKYPAPAQVLAQLAAKNNISRDSAKLLTRKKKGDAVGNDEAMMTGAAAAAGVNKLPFAPVLSGKDSIKLRAAAQESYRVVGELASAKVARAVGSERQLNEVMVDFWENHFNIFAGKDRTRYFLPEFDTQVIRPNALGKFRDLLGAVAKSDAMLYYLDNWESVADSGRPTLAPPPRRFAQQNPNARRFGQNSRVQQLTIGELMDRDLMPPAQRQRFANLPPERLKEVRNMTLGEAQSKLASFAQLANGKRPKGVNENYARELMELHTLGVDGGYTQQDVIQVARALTGWTIARGPNGGEFLFKKETHDAGAKTILGVQFPAGRGIEDGEEVLDMLAKSPQTAHFIATKLVRRFVSDTPPPALVNRVAQVFLKTGGDIRETLRAVITSPEFFSTAAYRSKVKSPFELVVSTLRAMGAQPDSTPRAVQFVSRLGEPLYGHIAPDGYPEVGEAWMNTGSILNRINFGLAAASGRVPGIRILDWPTTQELAQLPREQQVDGVIRSLLGGAASADTRQVLLTGTNPFLQSQPGSDTSFMKDDASATMMTDATGRKASQAEMRRDQREQRIPLARLQQQAARESAKPGQGGSLTQAIGTLPQITGFAQIVGLALGAPEFQRR
ncbi:MAG: DUF1800 domain-containing protein [Gemmatimonadaceae bacterium]